MSMCFLHQLQRYYHTVKYFNLRQITYRFWFSLKYPFYKKFTPLVDWIYRWKVRHADRDFKIDAKEKENAQLPCELSGTEHSSRREEKAEEILKNRFNFLNAEIQFGREIDWDTQQASKLWRYNLHYFAYAIDLAIAYKRTSRTEFYAQFKTLVLDWIQNNSIAHGDGWEPYPISLRTVNWIFAHALFDREICRDLDFEQLLKKSLFKQILFLERNLEYRLGCENHLIKNAKALAIAGAFFKGKTAARWLKKGTSILWRELERQVQEDGGHYEHSLMYHIAVLHDYLECIFVLKKRRVQIPEHGAQKVRKMLYFARNILPPDGNIPLIGDSGLEIAPVLQEALALGDILFKNGEFKSKRGQSEGGKCSSPHPSILPIVLKNSKSRAFQRKSFPNTSHSAFEHSGFYVMRAEDKYLILDCGKLGPDQNPAHGHCDMLSYELYLGNQRFVVDSGTYEYEAGEWRDFFRSTRAHNTVVVDGEEQSEIWASFRVARRALPIRRRFIEKDNLVFFEGSHDGFLRFHRGCFHTRKVFFIENNFFLIFDEITGKGEHAIESFVHFHPDVDVQIIEDASNPFTSFRASSYVIAEAGSAVLQVVPFGIDALALQKGETEPIQGWYSPEFGIRIPNSTLILHKKGYCPLHIGYLIVPSKRLNANVQFNAGRNQFSAQIEFPEKSYVLSQNEYEIHIEVAP